MNFGMNNMQQAQQGNPYYGQVGAGAYGMFPGMGNGPMGPYMGLPSPGMPGGMYGGGMNYGGMRSPNAMYGGYGGGGYGGMPSPRPVQQPPQMSNWNIPGSVQAFGSGQSPSRQSLQQNSMQFLGGGPGGQTGGMYGQQRPQYQPYTPYQQQGGGMFGPQAGGMFGQQLGQQKGPRGGAMQKPAGSSALDQAAFAAQTYTREGKRKKRGEALSNLYNMGQMRG